MNARLALEKLIVPIGLLLLWEATQRAGVLPTYLSSPSSIVAALVELTESGELPAAMALSLMRAYAGFFIGAGLGVVLGLIAGLSQGVREFIDPLVSFLYPIPKITFLLIFLLIFGLGTPSQIALVALAVFFPVFIPSRYAVQSVNQLYVWSGQNMGAPPMTVFFRVIVPAAAPVLFAGLRVGLAHSFVVLFASELIGGRSGLGFLIVDGEEAVRFDIMFVGIVGFALIGFASDRVLMALRRSALRGQAIGTEEQLV